MKPTQWAGHEENKWMPVPTTTPLLKPAIYRIQVLASMFGDSWTLESISVTHDNIRPIGVVKPLSETIKRFFESYARYASLGLIHKRGFLLHGPPGTGKTLAAMMICDEVVRVGGSAIISADSPVITGQALSAVRSMHPDMPLVCLWEDIENICEDDSYERATMTAMLDGDSQINRVVHIATTNHFQRLDAAFINRPGRFDDIVYVGAPEREVRLAYLQSMLPNEPPALIEELANKSDGLLLSHLRDTIVSVFVLGRSVNETITRLKKIDRKSVV